MYESLRARAHRARDKLNTPNIIEVMGGVFAAVRETASNNEGNEESVRAICVPDRINSLGKRLGIPIFND